MSEHHDTELNNQAVDQAALNGDINMLIKLHSQGHRGTILSSINAIKKGHSIIVEYLYNIGYLSYKHESNSVPWMFKSVSQYENFINGNFCKFAVKNNRLEILNFLYKNGYTCDYSCGIIAVRKGYLHFVKYLYAIGKLWDKQIYELSAEYGKISGLSWASYSKYGYGQMCELAAKHGQLEILKFLHDNNCPWSVDVCYQSALHGHLECLKYAREHGCQWNEQTCYAAAIGGHLEVLKWLHGQGCPWNQYACEGAAEKGNLKILKYLFENGCPCNDLTVFKAAENGHLNCLKYFSLNGYQISYKEMREWLFVSGTKLEMISQEVQDYLKEIS